MWNKADVSAKHSVEETKRLPWYGVLLNYIDTQAMGWMGHPCW